MTLEFDGASVKKRSVVVKGICMITLWIAGVLLELLQVGVLELECVDKCGCANHVKKCQKVTWERENPMGNCGKEKSPMGLGTVGMDASRCPIPVSLCFNTKIVYFPQWVMLDFSHQRDLFLLWLAFLWQAVLGVELLLSEFHH